MTYAEIPEPNYDHQETPQSKQDVVPEEIPETPGMLQLRDRRQLGTLTIHLH